jgi:hypothetical protein
MKQRDAAIANGFDSVDMNATIIPLPKQDASHGRVLGISLSNAASLQVRFDQGVSYWRWRSVGPNSRSGAFDFAAGVDKQAEAVAMMNGLVEGGGHATQLFVRVRQS